MRNLYSQSQAGVVYHYYADKATRKHKAKKFDDKFYDNFNDVLYNNKPFSDILKHDDTVGKCHFYALLLAKAMDNCKLKTGNLRRLDVICDGAFYEPFEHSWVEVGDYVFDTTLKQTFKKDVYYKFYEPEVYAEYSSSDLSEPKLCFLLAIASCKIATELLPRVYEIFGNFYTQNINDKTFMKNVDEILEKYNLKTKFNKYFNNSKLNFEINL